MAGGRWQVAGVECRVSSVGCRVLGVECRVSSVECRVSIGGLPSAVRRRMSGGGWQSIRCRSVGCRVSGGGCRVSGVNRRSAVCRPSSDVGWQVAIDGLRSAVRRRVSIAPPLPRYPFAFPFCLLPSLLPFSPSSPYSRSPASSHLTTISTTKAQAMRITDRARATFRSSSKPR